MSLAIVDLDHSTIGKPMLGIASILKVVGPGQLISIMTRLLKTESLIFRNYT
uniref:Uncharacterized protein n=1 Tax=Gloeothece verrucosa (strain PCC 7822) TaxID=497965 RepID=E0UIE5_GLOV7|nr:hypothetical protein Cyan7822_5024 [Gloeothece verrucosa PCC 7822]